MHSKYHSVEVDFDNACRIWYNHFKEKVGSINKELSVIGISFSYTTRKCTMNYTDHKKFMLGKIKYGF
jgi:hypothetical protein